TTVTRSTARIPSTYPSPRPSSQARSQVSGPYTASAATQAANTRPTSRSSIRTPSGCFVADAVPAATRRSVEAPGYAAGLAALEPASDDPRHVGQATRAAGRWVLWADAGWSGGRPGADQSGLGSDHGQ